MELRAARARGQALHCCPISTRAEFMQHTVESALICGERQMVLSFFFFVILRNRHSTSTARVRHSRFARKSHRGEAPLFTTEPTIDVPATYADYYVVV